MEQEARGVLPSGRIETTFLRAMVLFREGKWNEAEPLLRRVAETDESRIEVAIAMNILGNHIGWRTANEAEAFFLRSIEIAEEIGDRYGVAQTQHSLANLIGRDRNRRDEAEKLLRESLKIGEELKNLRHQAQVLRSLSFVVEHRSPSEAKQLLEQSLKLNQRARYRRGEDIVRRSLRQLRERYGL